MLSSVWSLRPFIRLYVSKIISYDPLKLPCLAVKMLSEPNKQQNQETHPLTPIHDSNSCSDCNLVRSSCYFPDSVSCSFSSFLLHIRVWRSLLSIENETFPPPQCSFSYKIKCWRSLWAKYPFDLKDWRTSSLSHIIIRQLFLFTRSSVSQEGNRKSLKLIYVLYKHYSFWVTYSLP